MKALLSGINSFTGNYLKDYLIKSGYEVYGLSYEDKFESSLICNISDKKSVDDAIKRVKPNILIHLAAISFVAHDDKEELYTTNILGTRNLLEAFKNIDVPHKHFIFPSTANVYKPTNQIITENSEIAPGNDYSISKATCENIVKIYEDYFDATILRFFNYTGLNQNTKFLIPKIVSHFIKKTEVMELGDVTVSRDFSDVRDIVKIYEKIISKNIKGLFNVCSGECYSIKKIIEICERITGHNIDVQVNKSFVRDNEIKTIIGSRDHLDKSIGPLERIKFEETLEWMLKS